MRKFPSWMRAQHGGLLSGIRGRDLRPSPHTRRRGKHALSLIAIVSQGNRRIGIQGEILGCFHFKISDGLGAAATLGTDGKVVRPRTGSEGVGENGTNVILACY